MANDTGGFCFCFCFFLCESGLFLQNETHALERKNAQMAGKRLELILSSHQLIHWTELLRFRGLGDTLFQK